MKHQARKTRKGTRGSSKAESSVTKFHEKIGRMLVEFFQQKRLGKRPNVKKFLSQFSVCERKIAQECLAISVLLCEIDKGR